MNRWLLPLFLLLSFSACSHKEKQLERHVFTNDIVCAVTPPLNQGHTSTCWAYASASLLESDWLKEHVGDTVRLAPMYVVRQKYLKQFDAYYYSQGREEIRSGGLGHSLLHVLQEDGLMPLEAYRGHPYAYRVHDHRRLLKELRRLARQAVKYRDLTTWRKRAAILLDEEMGAVPDTFLYKGTSYTPRSFADSLRLRAADYVSLTSFTHHPFHTSFPLEVPDNWEHRPCINLPLDELEQAVREALAEGRSVAWHGDVSEETFSTRQGIALWPKHPVTQADRQQYWEHFETTDDHMMHIVGTAHDEDGRFYYLLKNSYGKYPPYGGFLYMSDDYFRAKTLSVMMRKR